MADESFHVVGVPGLNIHVDDGVRREVERWLADKDRPETLDIYSLYDEEVTLISGMVTVVYSTTPASRAHDREHAKALEAERPVLDL